MAKAIKITDANFTENALTSISFVDPVPCTSISLDESSVALTSLTETTLTATVTPNNTTDEIIWASSDNTVATVADGVVKPLKGGSVTITAACGTKSASCEFTISAFLDTHLLYSYYLSEADSALGDSVNISGADASTTYGGTIYTDGTGKYARDPNNRLGDDKAYPIILPNGCTKLDIKVPSQSIKISICWCDSTQNSPGFGTIYMLAYDGVPWSSSISAGDRIATIPNVEGIDSIYISVYLANGLTQEMLDAITVEALWT